jgi:hypothetical protein
MEPLLERNDGVPVAQRQPETHRREVLQPVVDPPQEREHGKFDEKRAALCAPVPGLAFGLPIVVHDHRQFPAPLGGRQRQWWAPDDSHGRQA